MARSRIAGWLAVALVATFGFGLNPTGKRAQAQSTERIILIQEKQPDKTKKEDKTAPPVVDPFAGEAAPQEAPVRQSRHMIGDLTPGLSGLVLVTVPSLTQIQVPIQTESGIVFQTVNFATTSTRAVPVPIAGRGGFKIGENESVMPGSRAYFSSNYYNNVQGSAHGSDQPITVNQSFEFQGSTFDGQVTIPGVVPPRQDLNRQTLGIQKSFLDDRFSVGVRVPIFQLNGGGDFRQHDLGDLTFIVKYAPYVDPATGTGMSAGLAVTVPTGPDVETSLGNIHPTVLQPFVGYQFNADRFLLYGFSSVAVPTDDRDVTLLFNDVAIGYRLFEGDGIFRSLVPVFEVHITTPLDNQEAGNVISAIDLVALTGGVHIGLGERTLLTLGIATPVTGPRPYEWEGIVQFNFRF